MYRVLLVDDEPLILSGIRFMIDWEANDCEVVGTARNGRQALEDIAKKHPDIVIADINMPVMNGIELLTKAHKEFPETVFIMLTNLQEFDLVREALRLHAVDYLTKTQLEARQLEESLCIAKKECDQRSSLSRIRLVESANEVSQIDVLNGAVRQMLQGRLTPDVANILRKAGVTEGYGIIQLWFSPNKPKNKEEQRELLMWGTEIVSELAANSFSKHLLLEKEQSYLLVLYWEGTQEKTKAQQAHFQRKLTVVASNIMDAQAKFLFTGFFSGEETYPACKEELSALNQYYYLSEATVLHARDLPVIEYRTLNISGAIGRLKAELNNRSKSGCLSVIERIQKQIEELPHERSQAIWACNELYHCIHEQLPVYADGNGYFNDEAARCFEIEVLETRGDVLLWLQHISSELSAALGSVSSGRTETLNQAKQYVLDHLDRHITLQETADHVCISSSYLSSLFKKEFGQGFVDFVNQTKMEYACGLITEGKYRMNEIADQLGFENAYYFSKVFRRHIGMSPTEWLKGKR